MPVKVPNDLPAAQVLRDENIFVIDESRALNQDIRPLKIAIVNLMPTKQTTEAQLLRLIGNTPLQVEVTFLRTASYLSKNTPYEHLENFYTTLDQVKSQKFDGLIITGAPVEMMDFEQVDYWRELVEIIDWSEKNVFSTFYICWAAQAGLYHHYGVPKHELKQKCFGVYRHQNLSPNHPLMRGFDNTFHVPHSRHTEARTEDVAKVTDLDILSVSDKAGVYLVCSKNRRRVFAMGHSEYDPNTLKMEYERDISRGLKIDVPYHYFPDDDPTQPPNVRWRAHSNLLFQNWLNYCVYQETPFDISQIGK